MWQQNQQSSDSRPALMQQPIYAGEHALVGHGVLRRADAHWSQSKGAATQSTSSRAMQAMLTLFVHHVLGGLEQ